MAHNITLRLSDGWTDNLDKLKNHYNQKTYSKAIRQAIYNHARMVDELEKRRRFHRSIQDTIRSTLTDPERVAIIRELMKE